MSKPKFKKSIKGAAEYYESIEDYADRLLLLNEFEMSFDDPEDLKKGWEMKLYKWLRDNKL